MRCVQRGEASTRVTRDVSCARTIDGDPKAVISRRTPEIRRINQCAGCVQLNDEGILSAAAKSVLLGVQRGKASAGERRAEHFWRSEEHTSELQSRQYLVCRLLLEKKKN